jgi:hypothetical protein
MSGLAKILLARFRAGFSPPSWAFYLLVIMCLLAMGDHWLEGPRGVDSTVYAFLGILAGWTGSSFGVQADRVSALERRLAKLE